MCLRPPGLPWRTVPRLPQTRRPAAHAVADTGLRGRGGRRGSVGAVLRRASPRLSSRRHCRARGTIGLVRVPLWLGLVAVVAAACGSGTDKASMTEFTPPDRDIHSYARPWEARVTHVA